MSYNFSPQPHFILGRGLSTASMHAVTPPTIQAPLSIIGTYQDGAVHFAPDGAITGSSALNGDGSGIILGKFTKAVISFWARYNSGASGFGNSAFIGQVSGGSGSSGASNSFTQCSANDPLLGGPFMQNVAIVMGVFSVDLYLMDAVTRKGLLLASLNYVSGNGTNSTVEWFGVGAFESLIRQAPFVWNGSTHGGSNYFLLSPCDGFYSPPGAITTGTVSNTGGQFATLCVNSVADLPPPVFGTVRFVFRGVNGQLYPTASFPADVYVASNSFNGGVPIDGWHHYICSFDTSQLVTDDNGVQSIRAQWAMDRGGGPFSGGPIMDTAATAITATSQPMYSWASQSGVTGVLDAVTDDTWRIGAPSDAPVDFAYCYMGIVPDGGTFFDLTAPGHLDFFVTPQLTPVNLGFQGQNVPLLCNWMHTGGTQIGAVGGAPFFAVNAPNGRVWPRSGGAMTATDPPPIGA